MALSLGVGAKAGAVCVEYEHGGVSAKQLVQPEHIPQLIRA